jgi:hypothetical protein
MKSIMYLTLLLVCIFQFGCSINQTNQLDGSWKLVESELTVNDSVSFKFPGNIKSMDGSWIISNTHSIYLINYLKDGATNYSVDYSKSIIRIEKNILSETYLVSNEKNLIGKTLTFDVQQKGDSLFFSGPTGNSKSITGYQLYEVFVREK